jgi:hypothetical protein
MPRLNQDPVEDDEDMDDVDEEPRPKKKKKSRFPGWLKWAGATAAGAIVGGVAMRKYDEYFPPESRKNPDGEGPEGNPHMLPTGQAPAMPMPMPMPFPMPFPMFGQQTQQNPERPRKRRKSVGELKAELRARQQEERARRVSAAEESWWEDDD